MCYSRLAVETATDLITRFPFLFFGTTWMGVVMSEETGRDPNKDEATVAGDRAMLIYSVGEPLLCLTGMRH